jgi:hypothetical protein
MKVIFLDIDGVVDSYRSIFKAMQEWYGVHDEVLSKFLKNKISIEKQLNNIIGKRIKNHEFIPNFNLTFWPFDSVAVSLLHKLTRDNKDLKFVISSSWRLNKDINQLKNILILKGLQIPIIGMTRKLNSRGEEILAWLKYSKYANQIERYCVIDDEIKDLIEIDPEVIVKTIYKTGFELEDYEKVKKILNLK